VQIDPVWYTLCTMAPVALLQWWVTQKIHLRQLATAQGRHLKAQQATDKMLQQSRRQNAQLTQELAAARLALKRPPVAESSARTRSAGDARNALMKILDEAPLSKRALPIDGFAETMPSMQFQTSAVGPLQ